MTIIQEILAVLAAILVVITLPGSLYLFFISLAALRPDKAGNNNPTPVYQKPLAIIVPAHNEAVGILRTLNNLKALAAADGHTDIIVIADNCVDKTAEIAKAAQCRVLERNNPQERGKGYALDFAFKSLAHEAYDAYIVIDADSEADTTLLPTLRHHFSHGAEVIQTRYGVLNTTNSIRTQLLEIALAAFNILRPLGRHRCNLSAGILGNGFALKKDVLTAVPYTATSVVEDVEYHLNLIQAGYRVVFANTTTIRGEMPVTEQNSRSQRARWEGGRLHMLAEFGGSLLRACLHGRLNMLEPLFDLLLLPLAYHVLVLIIAGFFAALAFSPLLFLCAMAGIAAVLLHVIAAIYVAGLGWDRLLVLCRVPFYLFWKIRMIRQTLRSARKNSDWVRTERKD